MALNYVRSVGPRNTLIYLQDLFPFPHYDCDDPKFEIRPRLRECKVNQAIFQHVYQNLFHLGHSPLGLNIASFRWIVLGTE